MIFYFNLSQHILKTWQVQIVLSCSYMKKSSEFGNGPFYLQYSNNAILPEIL